jgi:hypothetical protein
MIPPLCQSARAHLDDYLGGELAPALRRDTDAHLAICPDCAAEFASAARLRQGLQSAVRSTPAPPALEPRVRRALQAASARPRTGLWAVAAAAAVILCFVLVNLLRVASNPEEAILKKTSGRLAAVLNVGLRDHLHCAVFRKYAKAPEPASQMAADLGAAFAPMAALIQAGLPSDFRILQGHRCEAGGRQFTHFIVAGRGKIASVILTTRLPGESLGGGIHQSGADRFQVVGLETGKYLVYIISDLDAQQNLQVAAGLAPTLRAFLAQPAG